MDLLSFNTGTVDEDAKWSKVGPEASGEEG
jgi:hypothetical protein